MKKTSLSLLLIAVASVLIVSCKQKNKIGAIIPNDAAIVIHLNASSLNSKLNWNEIKQTNWFKEAYSETPDSLGKKLMDDPQKAGMDIKSDFIFFTKNQGSNGYMAFEGYIKDAAAFEAFNKEISGNNAPISKDGDFSKMQLPGGAVVTWNKDRFAYLMDAPYMNMARNFSLEGGNTSEPSKLSPDTLLVIGKSLFDLDSDKSLGGNERFSTMLKEEGDLHMWMNSEYMYNGIGAGALSMMKVSTLIQGNVSASTVNFDNGKITFKTKAYYNKELADLFDKYKGKAIGSDLVNRIPSQNVVAAFVMNYPPEGLKEFLKVIGVDGMVNGFLGKANYSIDEFVKANKGDIIIAVTDLSIASHADTIPNPNGKPFIYNSTKPDVKVLFATSIKDRPAFDKLIGTVKAQGGDQLTQSMPEITYKLDNNWFAISNSADHVNKFLSGSNTNQAFADKISGHPFGGYIDIQKILTSTQSNVKDSSGKIALNASLQMWQNIIITGGEYKNGFFSGEAEINLVDKNTNSLKQLNLYFDQMSKIMKPKYKPYTDVNLDTIPLLAPDAEPAPAK